MNPFELTLEVKGKQPMDLAILRTSDTYHESSKDAKKNGQGSQKKEVTNH
jgi:hypothetical protein